MAYGPRGRPGPHAVMTAGAIGDDSVTTPCPRMEAHNVKVATLTVPTVQEDLAQVIISCSLHKKDFAFKLLVLIYLLNVKVTLYTSFKVIMPSL